MRRHSTNWTHKSTAKSKWPNPYALPKLARASTRKSSAFCSLRLIFVLFSESSNRIKVYLETLRDGRGSDTNYLKKNLYGIVSRQLRLR